MKKSHGTSIDKIAMGFVLYGNGTTRIVQSA